MTAQTRAHTPQYWVTRTAMGAAAMGTAVAGQYVSTHYKAWWQAWLTKQALAAQRADLAAVKANPLTYGGYGENTAQYGAPPPLHVDPRKYLHFATQVDTTKAQQNFIVVLRNKQELDAAFDRCGDDLTRCPPHLANFRAMVRAVRKLKNPLTQVQAVNAWVNTAIVYDNAEPATGRRRTLVETIEAGKGVCDEQAQLKLYALRRADFPAQDARMLVVAVMRGKQRTGNHAFAVARAAGQAWAMDNQQQGLPVRGQPVKAADRTGNINFDGTVFADMVHANSQQKPFFGGREIIPVQAITYVTSANYISSQGVSASRGMVSARPRLRQMARVSQPDRAEFDMTKALASERPETAAAVMRSLEIAYEAARPEPVKTPVRTSKPRR